MKRTSRKYINILNSNFGNPIFLLVNKENFLRDDIVAFEKFLFSNSFQEKLPIVLANIRV